jgi:nucleotide-binding universal stress UspA family protein
LSELYVMHIMKSHTVEEMMKEGEPYWKILSFSEGSDRDLIFTVARERTGIKGMFIESVRLASLKSASCPVLMVH